MIEVVNMIGAIDPTHSKSEKISILSNAQFDLAQVQIAHERQVVVFRKMNVAKGAIVAKRSHRGEKLSVALHFALMILRPDPRTGGVDLLWMFYLFKIAELASVEEKKRFGFHHVEPPTDNLIDRGQWLMRQDDVDNLRLLHGVLVRFAVQCPYFVVCARHDFNIFLPSCAASQGRDQIATLCSGSLRVNRAGPLNLTDFNPARPARSKKVGPHSFGHGTQ